MRLAGALEGALSGLEMPKVTGAEGTNDPHVW